jgi:diguanylate cyclase (GGDEF)-like protein
MLASLVLSGSSLLLLGAVALKRRRRRAAAISFERTRDEAVRAVTSLVEASRTSSDAVLHELQTRLQHIDGNLDCMLIFTIAGDELRCAFSGGSRAEHYRQLALRRDDERALPAIAARLGCRVLAPSGGAVLLPTDRRALAVPMIDGRVLRCVAYASSPCDRGIAMPEQLVRAISAATLPYSIAIERESDRADATHDGLTGLLGPRAFRQRLHEQLAVPHAAGTPAHCLWFVDTDCFKSINDRFGHRMGDAVLQAMAALLRRHVVPGTDLAARNGGDEFCALLRGTGKIASIVRAQAFCDAVRGHDFGIGTAVTASVGVAAYPHDAQSSSGLLELADAAMYHAKRNGRDRVAYAVERGRFDVIQAEAASGLSRSSPQWRSNLDVSYAERSSHYSSSFADRE